MRELFIAFVQKCLGIQSPSVLWITGGRVKYTYDLIKMKKKMKKRETKGETKKKRETKGETNERDFIQR